MSSERTSRGLTGNDDGEAEAARDACIRAVTQNARTQLVRAHPAQAQPDGVSLVRLDLLVEGQPRRCRCFFDHRTRTPNLVF